ncbi:MAG: hypothetical protein ACPGVT_09580 [Maricaulaceae bacterium]
MMSIVKSLYIFSIFYSLNVLPAIAQVDDFVIAEAQVADGDEPQDIGGGLYLVTVPPVYETVSYSIGGVQCDGITPIVEEWFLIPATYKTVTETKIIAASRTEIEIIDPIYDDKGVLLKTARASVKAIPAVTKEITRKIMLTPARPEKRYVPQMCQDKIKSIIRDPKYYLVKDDAGKIIRTFRNDGNLLAYLGSRKP